MTNPVNKNVSCSSVKATPKLKELSKINNMVVLSTIFLIWSSSSRFSMKVDLPEHTERRSCWTSVWKPFRNQLNFSWAISTTRWICKGAWPKKASENFNKKLRMLKASRKTGLKVLRPNWEDQKLKKLNWGPKSKPWGRLYSRFRKKKNNSITNLTKKSLRPRRNTRDKWKMSKPKCPVPRISIRKFKGNKFKANPSSTRTRHSWTKK